MRLSQKTVYQMSQTMNMPGNFWSTHQPRTLDATVERSQSHAVFLVLAHFYSCVNQNPHHFVLRHSTSSMSPSSSNSESSESSGSTTVKTVVFFNR
ncbi:hypothetical protein FD755_012642 [Muntiacus reevesi]|uniref:Uncharacterized protein n=1 Tax=Muntiacus reevesi TaxID=9886 RepID=A0A5N3XQA2_MUNRE|nr:hypothetical protein FD755_012642 [Muntiacus reevesi]